MRLTKLTVAAFRGIKRTELEFGPGLNILFGPNDLGKSTVATAIHAALLIPCNSSEASTFSSWNSAEHPSVELTFVNADGYWRVKKIFGSSSNGSAEFLYSKDGLTFTLEAKGREVEGRVRTMLGWGIPVPGGKGAPRQVTSFLANVLLANQTDTDTLLKQSLADDADESGKLRLTKALAVLAQDPLFKAVLDEAQAEYDAHFTESGRRKSGKNSKFKEASNRVKLLDDEIRQLQRQIDDSARIEGEVNVLRIRRSEVLSELNSATDELHELERRLERGAARAAADERVDAARQLLAQIDEQVARLASAERELAELQRALEAARNTEAEAERALAIAEAERKTAEEAWRVATSADAERELEVRRAQLSERGASIEVELSKARARRAELDAAVALRGEVQKGEQQVTSALSAQKEIADRADAATRGVAAAREELEKMNRLLAFVRWRAAVQAAEDARRAKEAVAAARAEAEQKESEAGALASLLADRESELSELTALVPTAEELKTLRALDREREKAEAALGGGISVALRALQKVNVGVAVDEQQREEVAINQRHEVQAERTLQLTVDELLEIDIVAGSAEARAAFESLRSRWSEAALPVFKRARVDSLAELEAVASRHASLRDELEKVKRQIEQLDMAAAQKRELAKAREEAVQEVPAELIEERRVALGDYAPNDLEPTYELMQRPSERMLEDLRKTLERTVRDQADDLNALEKQLAVAASRVLQQHERAAELREKFEATSVEATQLDSLVSESTLLIDRLQRDHAATATELQQLTAKASEGTRKLQEAVRAAEEEVERLRQERDGVRQAAAATEAALNARQGAINEMRVQIDRLDRAAAERSLRDREAEFAALSGEPIATESDVEAARARVEELEKEYDHARDELNVKEGALSRVGGAALREEMVRLEEAYAAAVKREQELEVDADAWKLLRDTLREVENSEGVHLGRALAVPVSKSFEELTANRYRGLSLGPTLQAETLEVTGVNTNGDGVIEALSVGTRAQLAALIRLAIANQLKTTILLDDHLVHTDRTRLGWFRDALQRTAENAQVIVLTCRAEDYLSRDEIPHDAKASDSAAGMLRAINMEKAIERFSGRS